MLNDTLFWSELLAFGYIVSPKCGICGIVNGIESHIETDFHRFFRALALYVWILPCGEEVVRFVCPSAPSNFCATYYQTFVTVIRHRHSIILTMKQLSSITLYTAHAIAMTERVRLLHTWRRSNRHLYWRLLTPWQLLELFAFMSKCRDDIITGHRIVGTLQKPTAYI